VTKIDRALQYWGITDWLEISLPVKLKAQNLQGQHHFRHPFKQREKRPRRANSYLLFFKIMSQAVQTPNSWLLVSAIVQFSTMYYLLLVDMDPVMEPFHYLLTGLEVCTDFANENMLECRRICSSCPPIALVHLEPRVVNELPNITGSRQFLLSLEIIGKILDRFRLCNCLQSFC
jgi:hypothetical protein